MQANAVIRADLSAKRPPSVTGVIKHCRPFAGVFQGVGKGRIFSDFFLERAFAKTLFWCYIYTPVWL
jgi:hypothetical protein